MIRKPLNPVAWWVAVALSILSTVALIGCLALGADLGGFALFVAPGYPAYMSLVDLVGMPVNIHTDVGAIILFGFILNTLFWLMFALVACALKRRLQAR